MKKRLTSAVLLSLLSTAGYAGNYEAEVGFGYSDIEEADAFTISGELFFDSVNTDKGPHLEASFLDQASGVKLEYSDVDGADDNPFSLNGRFVTKTDFIIEAGYVDMGATENIRIGLGTYITAKSDIVISYINNDDENTDTLMGDYHAVQSLSGGASLSYNVIASYIDAPGDSGVGLGGSATYFLNNDFGFGGEAIITSVGDVDTTTIGLHIDYFFSPDLHVQGRIASFDGDDVVEDRDVISIAVFVRL